MFRARGQRQSKVPRSSQSMRLLFGEGRASSSFALRLPRVPLAPIARVCLVGLAASGAASGCGGGAVESRGALHYTEDAKRAYDKAMLAFEEHDWEEAKRLFKEVKKKYSYSRYARLAELRLADADFET